MNEARESYEQLIMEIIDIETEDVILTSIPEGEKTGSEGISLTQTESQ